MYCGEYAASYAWSLWVSTLFFTFWAPAQDSAQRASNASLDAGGSQTSGAHLRALTPLPIPYTEGSSTNHPPLAAIQAEARQHSTDTFTLEEIEAEIQAVRQAQR